MLACILAAVLNLFDDRNRARAAERLASTRLVQAVESIPLGFLLFDERDRLLLANRRASDILDVDRRALRFGMSRSDYRSEEHTSELQSLMRISYAVFCLKK